MGVGSNIAIGETVQIFTSEIIQCPHLEHIYKKSHQNYLIKKCTFIKHFKLNWCYCKKKLQFMELDFFLILKFLQEEKKNPTRLFLFQWIMALLKNRFSENYTVVN